MRRAAWRLRSGRKSGARSTSFCDPWRYAKAAGDSAAAAVPRREQTHCSSFPLAALPPDLTRSAPTPRHGVDGLRPECEVRATGCCCRNCWRAIWARRAPWSTSSSCSRGARRRRCCTAPIPTRRLASPPTRMLPRGLFEAPIDMFRGRRPAAARRWCGFERRPRTRRRALGTLCAASRRIARKRGGEDALAQSRGHRRVAAADYRQRRRADAVHAPRAAAGGAADELRGRRDPRTAHPAHRDQHRRV